MAEDVRTFAYFAPTCARTPARNCCSWAAEFGQRHEWREHEQLDWPQLQDPTHQALRECVRELNRLYLASPQLHGSDCDPEGFRWVDLHNAGASVWAFQRRSTGQDAGAPILCVFNATPVPRDRYTLRVADPGEYSKIFDSDAACFGGSGYNNEQRVHTVPESLHDNIHTLTTRLAAARRDVLSRILNIATSIQAGSPRPLGATLDQGRRQFRGVFEPCDACRIVPVRRGERRRIGTLRIAGAHRQRLARPAVAAPRGRGNPLRILRGRPG